LSARAAAKLAWLILISSLFILPNSLQAQSARDSLAAGKRAYDAADYPNAMRLLPIGLAAAGPRDSTWVAGAHMLADVLQDQGKDSLAMLWARWIARTAPAFPTDSNTYPPRAARLIAAGRKAAGPQTAADSGFSTTLEPSSDTSSVRGQLRIARGTGPSIAVIEGLGTMLTGESRSLPAGTYTVRITPEGFAAMTVAREVIPGWVTVIAPLARRPVVAAAPAAGAAPAAVAATPVRGGLLSSAGTTVCGVLNQGQVACWGENGLGQLGGGVSDTSWHAPVLVAGHDPLRAVSVGATHVCALTTAGKAYCWGYGASGELGQGQTASSPSPVSVAGGQVFVEIAAGGQHTCGLVRSGQVLCWGSNHEGQLGNRNNNPGMAPVAVGLPNGLSIVAITAGTAHSCALASNGAAYCWGANASGQLGNGETRESNAPVLVQSGVPLKSISAGGNHGCGITGSGMTLCWGANANGETGTGQTSPDVTKPQPVTGGLVFDSIEAAESHTCALTRDGTAYCWGEGRSGELGNGQSGDSPRPVLVVGGDVFKALSLGLSSSCGLTADGITKCWGSNARGQLGGLGGHSSAVPVPVLVKPAGRPQRMGPFVLSAVHERFDDGDWTVNPAWAVDSASGARLSIAGGALTVARHGSHGLTLGAGLALPIHIPVTRTTQIQFDVEVVADSLRSGCGVNCGAWPAMVRVRVRNSDLSESEVWYAFSDKGGQGRTLGNVVIVGKNDAPAGTWLREQKFTIRDALPRADTILQVSLGGIGGDFEAHYDNIYLPVPVLTSVDIKPDSLVLTHAAPTSRLRGSAKDAAGADLPFIPLTWTSTDTAVARVDSLGTVTGVKTGHAMIRATTGTFSDSAKVTVQMAPTRGPARRRT
jgi:alpha-tubulin suppressor-like RCC1 family protein